VRKKIRQKAGQGGAAYLRAGEKKKEKKGSGKEAPNGKRHVNALGRCPVKKKLGPKVIYKLIQQTLPGPPLHRSAESKKGNNQTNATQKGGVREAIP